MIYGARRWLADGRAVPGSDGSLSPGAEKQQTGNASKSDKPRTRTRTRAETAERESQRSGGHDYPLMRLLLRTCMARCDDN